MKMETEVKSPAAGTVSAVYVHKGETVQSGQDLLAIA
jgi:biotin carboxyl carrier protein